MSRRVGFIGREEELKTVSTLINQKNSKHILFIEAPGGVGKTRLLQEIERIYKERTDVIIGDIIDRDNHILFSIKILKESIIKKLGNQHFKEYLELEREFSESFISHNTYVKMKKVFIDSFNDLVKDKKFLIFIDTAEKITKSKFWKDSIDLVSQLNNFVVIISGREITINQRHKNRIKNFLSTIHLKEFTESDGKLYFEKKSELENIKPLPEPLLECLVMLSNGKPILLDLTAEWILESGSRDAPEEFIANVLNLDLTNCMTFVEYEMEKFLYQKQKEFEKSLVIHYENISDTTQQIITLLTYIPLLNLEMLTYIWEDENLIEAFNKTSEFVFVKNLQNGYITLHDEMRRLLNTHVIPRIDSDGRRREHYIIKIIPYFEKRVKELKAELKETKVEDYTLLFKLKRELNSNIIHLIKNLFSINKFSDKAMTILSEEFFNAHYRNNFPLMKELITSTDASKIALKEKVSYVRMKAKSLSIENKNEEAKALIEECKKSNKAYLDEIDIGRLDNMLAGINTSIGDLLEAKTNQLNAFRIFKKYNLITSLAPCSNHLGVIHKNMGCLDKAIEYHKKALKYGKESLSKVFRGYIFNHLAEIFRERGEYSNALENALTAKELWRKGKALKASVRGDITLGNIYRDKGAYTTAYEYYMIAKDELNEDEYLEETLNLYINMGKFYWFRYEDTQNEKFLKEAKRISLKAEKLSRDNYHNTELVQVLSHLSNIYWDENNRVKARENLEEFYVLSKEHSLSYFTVDAILGFAEFDYDEKVPNLETNIKKYADELKEYESEYNFPHFFARMIKYQAHLLFDNENYQEAIALYAQSLIMLSKHGGYSKYSMENELNNFSKRLKSITDKTLLLKLIYSLCDTFKENTDIDKNLKNWLENKRLQIEYGV